MGPRRMKIGSGEGFTTTNHNLYSSSILVRVIKYKRLKWAEHIARIEEVRSAFKTLTGKITGKRPL